MWLGKTRKGGRLRDPPCSDGRRASARTDDCRGSVIALPQLRGPALAGLPQDDGGFIPVEEYGQVRGVERVWAAGDATDTPIKQGGVAAQLADTAAQAIAQLAGVSLRVSPFAPVLEGLLMTGGTPRYLLHRPASGAAVEESAFSEMARGAGRPKIATRYLEPQLRPDRSATTASSA
jgi:sulfide:quinone oxidoreductase